MKNESKFYKEAINGEEKFIYENDIYDISIERPDNTQNANVNVSRKTQNNDAIINQLISDLIAATIKIDNLLQAFNLLYQSGSLDKETVDLIKNSIYSENQDSTNQIKR